MSGKWILLNRETLEISGEFTDGDEPIQVIQFAPNGELIAIGSRNNNVYLYRKSDDDTFSRLGKFVVSYYFCLL